MKQLSRLCCLLLGYLRLPCSEANMLRLIAYAMGGLVSSSLHATVYLSFTLGLGFPYLVANAAGFCSGSIVSFAWHKYITFKCGKNVLQSYPKFFVTNSLGLGLSQALLWTSVNYLGFSHVLSVFYVIAMVAWFTFTLNRLWVFSPKAL